MTGCIICEAVVIIIASSIEARRAAAVMRFMAAEATTLMPTTITMTKMHVTVLVTVLPLGAVGMMMIGIITLEWGVFVERLAVVNFIRIV